jgi:hypothetical protein
LMRSPALEDALERTHPKLPLMTCAVCGWPCVTEGAATEHFRDHVAGAIGAGLVIFGGRINARPLCAGCMKSKRPTTGGWSGPIEDDGTGTTIYDAGIRAMEDSQ